MSSILDFKTYKEFMSHSNDLEIMQNDSDAEKYFGSNLFDKMLFISEYCDGLAEQEIQEANILGEEAEEIRDKYKKYAEYLITESEEIYVSDQAEFSPWIAYENKINGDIFEELRGSVLKKVESKEYISDIISKLKDFNGKNYSLKTLTFKTNGVSHSSRFPKSGLPSASIKKTKTISVMVVDGYDILNVPLDVFMNPNLYPEYYRNNNFVLLNANSLYFSPLFGMPQEVQDVLNEEIFQTKKLEIAQKPILYWRE